MPYSRFLSPASLVEYETRPEVAILRHGYGLGRLLPRPAFAGYDFGRAVDKRLKAALRVPVPQTWDGVTVVERRSGRDESEDAEVAEAADRAASCYLASGFHDGLAWDPTWDRVAYRMMPCGVPVGGIPDAFRGGDPVDLKGTRGNPVLSWDRAYGPCKARRVARGSASPGEWLVRRMGDWATAAVFYAWVRHGFVSELRAEWHQVDDAGCVRVVEARIGPEFVKSVEDRCVAAWAAFDAKKLPAMYDGIPPSHVAVLVG